MRRRRLLSCLLAGVVPGRAIASAFAPPAVSGPLSASAATLPDLERGVQFQGADDVGAAALDETAPQTRAASDAAPAGPGPWALIAPLKKGREIGLGWSIQSFSSVRKGAATLTLTRRGARASVDICARRGQPRGIASSRYFDFVLMNDADGRTVTDESLGRVIRTLAVHVKRNEKSRAARVAARRGMLPHDTRVALYVPVSPA